MGERRIKPKFNIYESYKKMNISNPYIFGIIPVSQSPANTFIGGVASDYPTKLSLANKLGILESNISYFNINGDEIQAKIDVDYIVSSSKWVNDSKISYYIEKGIGRVLSIESNAFSNTTKLTIVEFLKATSISQSAFYLSGLKRGVFHEVSRLYYYRTFQGSNPNLLYLPKLKFKEGDGTLPSLSSFGVCKNVFIPVIEEIGNTQGNENHFSESISGVNIWVNPILQTSNNGAEEGDIAYARSSKSAIIDYSQTEPNGFFNAPAQILDLTIGDKGATYLQLNFTPPTSVNTIEHYDIELNGVITNKIYNSGEYISGLSENTNYIIKVYPRDIYYNKVEPATLNTTTNTVYTDFSTSILSYYKLETDALDSKGTKNGTENNVTYQNGYALFNGSSNIVLPANIYTNPIEFSYSLLIHADDSLSEYRIIALNNNNGAPFTLLRFNNSVANRIQSYVNDGVGKTVNIDSFNTTELLHISVSIIKNGLAKLYINGSFYGSVSVGNFNQVSTLANTIGSGRDGLYKFKGKIKGVSFWNRSLLSHEHYEISKKQLANQSLI
jgi:hypothetical protein